MGLAHGQTSAPGALPEGVVAFVELGRPSSFDAKASNLLRQALPMPTGPALTAALPYLLKTTAPVALDLGKPVQIVVLEPPLHKSPVKVFSVTNADFYLGKLLPSLKEERQDGNVHVYKDEGTPLLNEADWGDEVGAGVKPEASSVAIGIVGNRAAVGADVEAVKKVLAMVEAGSFGSEPLYKGQDAGATVRVKKLLSALDSQGGNPFDFVRTSMMPMMSMNAPPGQDAEQVQKVLQAELDAVQSLAAQMDTLGATVLLEPDAVVLSVSGLPVSGSGLANYVASVNAGDFLSLRFMPADSVAVMACKLGDFRPFLDWYVGFVGKMLPAEATAEMLESLTSIVQKLGALMGDEMSLALKAGPQGLPVFVEAVAVKDAQKLDEAMQDALAQWSKVKSAYGKMGMDMDVRVERDAVSHAGHQIHAIQFDFRFPQVPGPMGEQVAHMQQMMMDMMYGKDHRAYWTYVDSMLVYAQGEGALDVLKGIVDGSVKSAAGSEGVVAALKGVPSGPTGLGYASLEGLADAALSFAKMMGAPPAFANVRIEKGPPITFAAWKAEGGAVEKRIRVPVSAVANVVKGYMGAAMAIQAQQEPLRMP
jgi:hypothetical protein